MKEHANIRREFDMSEQAIVLGFYGAQCIIAQQQGGMYPDGRTLHEAYARMGEEGHEYANEVFTDDGSPEAGKKIVGEAADLVIGIFGCMVARNLNLGLAVAEKLSSMIDKYNVDKIAALMSEGMSQDEAVAHMKSIYKGGDTNSV